MLSRLPLQSDGVRSGGNAAFVMYVRPDAAAVNQTHRCALLKPVTRLNLRCVPLDTFLPSPDLSCTVTEPSF